MERRMNWCEMIKKYHVNLTTLIQLMFKYCCGVFNEFVMK